MKHSCTCGGCDHFLPVNEEKDKEVEEEHNDEEKEEEITTTMQPSAAMQQGFTHGQGNCFLPVNKIEKKGKEEEKEEEKGGGGGGEGGDLNCDAVFAAMQQSCIHITLAPLIHSSITDMVPQCSNF